MHDLGPPDGVQGANLVARPPGPPEPKRARLARWFDSWMRSLGMAFVLFLVVRTFLLEAFQIPSGSMESTLLAGDFLFVNKAVYGAQIPGTEARLPAFDAPARGDVIVFAYPKDPALNYVKRVIGMPGDTVAMHAGRVWVNGRLLAEPYVQRTDPTHDVVDPQFAWPAVPGAARYQVDINPSSDFAGGSRVCCDEVVIGIGGRAPATAPPRRGSTS